MTDRSDRIAAFLDGTLDEEALLAFEAEMERDSALAAEVARFADNDDLLRAAFDPPMQQPVDPALLSRMGLGDPPAADGEGAASARAANDNLPVWRRWSWPVGGAIAASLAVVMLAQSVQSPPAGQEFARVLDATPSATVAQLAGGGSLTPRLTFKAQDGRYCREYVMTGNAGDETGIACRRDGAWTVEARVKGGSALPGSERIVTASGEQSSTLDEAYARLGASDPLDTATEKAAIAKAWMAP